jgi:hypothetical protein
MATMLSITINAPATGAFDRKSAEVGFLLRVLETVEKELGRGRGTVTSGTILTYDTSLDSPTTQGSWTYTPVASNP